MATYDEHPNATCSQFPDYTEKYRVAVMHSEMGKRDLAVPGPLVSAFTDVIKYDSVGACLPRSTSPLDARVNAAVGSFGIWEDFSQAKLALQESERLKVSFCGITQQLSWWTKDCASVMSGLGIQPQNFENTYDPDTGVQYRTSTVQGFGNSARCDLREPRRFTGTCPDGFCGSNGVCVAARCPDGAGSCAITSPDMVYFDRRH